ncbi:MAG: isoprenyl transferase [Candidatus Omnitrophica bacterium]|nr:isoprenyl transferase [Candidatus Omnitrophota bacterium]
MQKTPGHIAIIMDGNRRWASKRRLPAIMGHRQGVRSVEKVMEAARDAGVNILTLYTFSTENWSRPEAEVNGLMDLIEKYLDNEQERLVRNKVRLNVIGRRDRLRPSLLKKIEKVKELTKADSKFMLNLALDYGSRDEITGASRNIAKDAKSGKIDPDDITESLFSEYLFTGGLPDPDLLIRTGGESRVSNFLLWQISYSEFYITNKLWPDFGKKDLMKAIDDFKKSDRRIGA